jgi:hypothetical protein
MLSARGREKFPFTQSAENKNNDATNKADRPGKSFRVTLLLMDSSYSLEGGGRQGPFRLRLPERGRIAPRSRSCQHPNCRPLMVRLTGGRSGRKVASSTLLPWRGKPSGDGPPCGCPRGCVSWWRSMSCERGRSQAACRLCRDGVDFRLSRYLASVWLGASRIIWSAVSSGERWRVSNHHPTSLKPFLISVSRAS